MPAEFIDYRTLKEFYTIAEACELLDISKQDLRTNCENFDITPTRNELGEAVISKYDFRRIHNKLYYESHDHSKEWDPWK